MEVIDGTNGLYEIHATKGLIWSISSQRYLKAVGANNGYLVSNIISSKYGRRTVCLHRLLAEYFINNPNNYKCVDHIDGNRHNNGLQNLRWVTHSQNNHNRIGMKGYYFHKMIKKWLVSIQKNGKRHFIGFFNTEEEAKEAHKKASRELYGDIKYGNTETLILDNHIYENDELTLDNEITG